MQAKSIVPILDKFQEMGWPGAIEFSELVSIDPQRIHQVVNKLNQNLGVISFFVQGNSICWRMKA